MKNILRLVVLVPVVLAGSGQSPNRQADIRVTEMKALLYFDQDGTLGTFDAMEAGPDAPALWNTSTGEGAAGGKSSNTTVVLVRITGPHETPRNATLHVVATADWPTPRSPLADRRISLKPYFGLPVVWIPVVLYGTGCARVTVTASVEGSTPGVTRAIAFRCGE
jgi:hypothetical protein